MYEYVPKSHVTPYRLLCQDMLSALQAALKKEHKVTFQYQLIGSGFSIGDCISKYSIDELRQSVDRYLTDNLEIGDIFVRNEDGLEYLVAKYEDKTPAHKVYRCVSLQDDKEFTLHSITEIQRTDKHINISRLRGYLW